MSEADESHLRTTSLNRFLRATQRELGVTGEVGILITSNRNIHRLNRRFRGKDKPTDVLSFPAESPNGKHKLAGDIAISAQIAKANAASLGHSLDTELKILLLHGLLHLAGHDHESDNGKMARLEQKLRAKLKLPTGLIERTKNAMGPANVDPAALGRVFPPGSNSKYKERPASGKATTSIVPSKSKTKPKPSLPKATGQRTTPPRRKAGLIVEHFPARLKPMPFPKTHMKHLPRAYGVKAHADEGGNLHAAIAKHPAEGGRIHVARSSSVSSVVKAVVDAINGKAGSAS